MYRKGHYGVALLVFAPVGFALVQAGHASLALVTGGTMLWFAMLPDVDHRIPGISHRGITHTLVFALAVGGVLGGAGYLLQQTLPALGDVPGPVSLAALGFGIGSLTVLAHLVGDLLTPMGVALFWPLTDRRYSLSLAPADSRVANWGLFGLGIAATGGAAYLSLVV